MAKRKKYNPHDHDVFRIDPMDIPELVRARKAARVSQSEAAEYIGVTRMTIYNWEHWSPTRATIPESAYFQLLDYYDEVEKSQVNADKSHRTAYLSDDERISREEQQQEFMAREKANVSLADAAEKAGIPGNGSVVGKWESGFEWEKTMPRYMYDILMDYYKTAEPSKKKRRAISSCRVSEEERVAMIEAREAAGITKQQAACVVNRNPSVIGNWEEENRANAPRYEYEQLMAFYKEQPIS